MGVLSVRVGARSSRLSQAQTAIVSDLLRGRFGDDLGLEFVHVKTRGDRAPPEKPSLGPAGAKGAFTGDIEKLLLDGKIDIAIHSMKDLTSEQTEGLVIGATPPRSDPRDALVAGNGVTIKTLPTKAKVGTSSLRRKAHLLKMRRDLEVVELHGNVDTRLHKVFDGGGRDLDAIVLAVAGLERIGEGARISQRFSIDQMVPAVGQGIIAVQMRRRDNDIAEVLSRVDDEATRIEWRCEQAFAQRLGADCNVPVGGCARVSGTKIRMGGMLAREDGTDFRKKRVAGPSGEAVDLGTRLAEELLEGAMKLGGAAS
ncbi:MAG TPA: hydroxymethylbilane synthase [Nitrososphaerales archaeon]|nr:hydroxymethylbilane synthase [Nitrososphaerales archaeon]